MPVQLNDLDVIPEVRGLSSALIVPCNMCPAVSVAVRENRPFLQLFRGFLKSVPFEQHIRRLQDRLKENGVDTQVFKSSLPHQWFLCMWTAGQRKKLQKAAGKYEAAIVLGCPTAKETVRESVRSTGCKVIEGMEIRGFMNAKMKLQLPGKISFEDCKTVPISLQEKEQDVSA